MKGLNLRKTGGCIAAAFFCNGFEGKDPELTLAIENVLHYLEALLAQPRHIRLAVSVAWPAIRDDLAAGLRWAKVKGPMSSAIATLWDFSFEPRASDQWVDAEGFCWDVDLDDPCILSAVREVLETRFQQHIWSAASVEHCAPLGEKQT